VSFQVLLTGRDDGYVRIVIGPVLAAQGSGQFVAHRSRLPSLDRSRTATSPRRCSKSRPMLRSGLRASTRPRGWQRASVRSPGTVRRQSPAGSAVATSRASGVPK
jgi:hypothetical protein